MRDRLKALWDLRHSSNGRVWWLWRLSVPAICLILAAMRWLWVMVFLGGAVGSMLLCCIAAFWGIFHPRAVLPFHRAVWRWAVGATVVGMLAGYAGVLDLAGTLLAATVPIAGILSVIGVLLPILLGLCLLYGWLGATVSAYVVRRWEESARLTHVGLTAWWLLGLAYMLAVWAAKINGTAHLALYLLIFLVPLLTCLACLLARNPEWELRRLTERALQRLSRYLTLRWRWGKRTFNLDFRGALLGLLVATAVFSLSRSLLKAPSAALLVWMIQVRNQEARGAWNSPRPDDQSNFYGSDLREFDKDILTPRRIITLIDLDTPVLRAAIAPSDLVASQPPKNVFDLASVHSEAALQALLIRRLRALDAAVIVVNPPQEQPEPPSDSKESGVTAKRTEAGRKRLQQDETLLADAIKAAGNVVLATPESGLFHRQGAAPITELAKVAQHVGSEALPAYGSIRLPVLENSGKNGPVSLPIVIAQIYAAHKKISDTYEFKRHALVPVDFRSAKPGHDFLHITASSLLLPDNVPPTENLILNPRGEWKSLQECVRNRIVFLDSTSPHFHETPLGSLPAREVLAYGTATVLAHDQGARVTTRNSLLLTLLIGILMGILCAHRTPFEAVGRLFVMSVLILFTSLFFYMYWALWLDAVVPLTASLLTYLLVTQLAFTQQREKDRDLLKRFVAPDFVDAMLNHPTEHLGLSGKLSHVCVLFADVRNFTGFAERHTPEQVFEAVNQYMTALTNALHAYGGVLDKYTGDGLMAWFPAEADARVQIEKAVEASLAMRDAALAISRERMEQGKPALQFGIGMHYGEAMIGLVGNEEHQINYTALGHAVIVSARLQTLAGGGEVIISEAVYAALGENFRVEAQAPVAVKGISDLVHPYLVLSHLIPAELLAKG